MNQGDLQPRYNPRFDQIHSIDQSRYTIAFLQAFHNWFQKRTLNLVNFTSQKYVDKSATDTLYPFKGLLADFYKKIEDPLTLFTLEEKGLTTNSLKVDKNLTKENLDGIVKPPI
mgnify:CR=1 FL=1